MVLCLSLSSTSKGCISALILNVVGSPRALWGLHPCPSLTGWLLTAARRAPGAWWLVFCCDTLSLQSMHSQCLQYRGRLFLIGFWKGRNFSIFENRFKENCYFIVIIGVLQTVAVFLSFYSSLVDELKESMFPVLRVLLQHICVKVLFALMRVYKYTWR